jgi:hypothetical protein
VLTVPQRIQQRVFVCCSCEHIDPGYYGERDEIQSAVIPEFVLSTHFCSLMSVYLAVLALLTIALYFVLIGLFFLTWACFFLLDLALVQGASACLLLFTCLYWHKPSPSSLAQAWTLAPGWAFFSLSNSSYATHCFAFFLPVTEEELPRQLGEQNRSNSDF